MKSPVLLDASAVLAWLHEEPGAEVVQALLDHAGLCRITAANQAELITKTLDRGLTQEAVRSILAGIDCKVIDILGEDGENAGWMRPLTRAHGLGLGDRLCLAVAKRLNACVVTADRPWLALAEALQLDIRCIRPDRH